MQINPKKLLIKIVEKTIKNGKSKVAKKWRPSQGVFL